MSSAARSTLVGVVAAVAAGLGAALQTRVNGSLAVHVGSGFGAAVLSFGSGLVLMTVVVGCRPAVRQAVGRVVAALRTRRLRWWEVLGGAGGACYVAAQGLTVGTLGVALFMVAVVAGQAAGSLVVDRVGLAPGGVRPVTVGRAAGPVLTVVAVVVAVSGAVGDVDGLWLAVAPAVAGAAQAWQQAVNGRVRVAAGSPVPWAPDRADSPAAFASVAAATFGNFLGGTVVLVVAFAVSLVVVGPPTGTLPTDFPADLVLWSGGLLGITFIAIQAAVVHRIGVLLLGLGMIAGQMGGALLLDLLTPGAAPPGPATYAGAALTLVAVSLPLLESRLRR